MNVKHTAIDLFSGAGGLSVGLRESGFNIVAASEIEETYASTFAHNHNGTILYTGDIRELKVDTVLKDTGLARGELDLLAGGPPCQGFSINAPIRSLRDDRNHLYIEFMRFIEQLMPKTVLIENVPGIVSMAKGTVMEAIYSAIEELGYRAHHMILYAAHYGIPQMRWRTIILSSRKDIELPSFPEPKHRANGYGNFTGSRKLCFRLPPEGSLLDTALKPPVNVQEAISDLPIIENGGGSEEMDYDKPPCSEYQVNARNGSTKLENHKSPKLHAINLERMKYIKPGGSWRDLPTNLLPAGLQRARRSDHTRRYGRLQPDGLATTIMTKCDPHWGAFFHYEQDRVISVREAARIQSFPDDFRFFGSLVKQYQQVGNAVPPILAKALGEQIMEALG